MATENTKLGIGQAGKICLQALLSKIKTKPAKIKKTIIACAVSFILGCAITGGIAHTSNQRQLRQYNNTVRQYRDDAEKSNALIISLQNQITAEQSDYKRLTANNNDAIRQLSESFTNITKTGNSVQSIRQAVANIRAACKILENNSNNRNSDNGDSNNSSGIHDKKVGNE